MSRKPANDAAEQGTLPKAPPLPSSGGSYEIEGGELRQTQAPTAPADPAAPSSAAPSMEA